jgi:hypothetical protein
MKFLWCLTGAAAMVVTMPNLAHAALQVQPQSNSAPSQSTTASQVQVAGLFRVLDVAEDIDDLAKGNIGGIDPIKQFNRDVEDAMDDTRDEIRDFNDDVSDSVRDFNRSVDRAADDINDWFD